MKAIPQPNRRSIEKRALQVIVSLGSLVPLLAGGKGMLLGPRMVDAGAVGLIALDSHFRYLSGLLFAIGLSYAYTVPHIEKYEGRFLVLTSLVVTGGVGRLISILTFGLHSHTAAAALVMELVVTPSLAMWQRRVAGFERE